MVQPREREEREEGDKTTGQQAETVDGMEKSRARNPPFFKSSDALQSSVVIRSSTW